MGKIESEVIAEMVTAAQAAYEAGFASVQIAPLDVVLLLTELLNHRREYEART
jgi:hypothetical protein